MSTKKADFVVKDIVEGDVVTQFLKEGLQATRLDIRENFHKSSDPDGKPWTPLKMPRPRDGSTGPPLQDTKSLYRSALHQGAAYHVETLTSHGFTIGTNHPLANVHGDGAKIFPKKKWLTIPLTKEAAKAGGASNFGRKLFFLMTKGGNAFLAETTPKQKKLKLQYLLKKFVVIPAREFIGIGNRLMKKLEDIYVKTIVDKYHGTGG